MVLNSAGWMPTTGTMETKPTCIVADDHPAVLESVCRYLESKKIRVVGRARHGEEAVALVEAHRPALALLDVRMPQLAGTAAVRRLSRTTPQCSCVVYSGFGDGALLTEALDAGARGFVLKDAPLDNVVRALETVLGGGMYIDPALADAVIRASQGEVGLTPRERDVLRLLADGHSNESIGRELFISPDTARTQLGVAMAKLGAATRTQAVAIALRSELIS
ncbi:MAG: response regulator transcription factor [Actinobacteria bacterium]|nr:response regulator transcription factor [Actinomycetota bacterium]